MAKKIADISHHHPVSDWNKAKTSCSFLISKATQGTTYVDTTLNSFISGCEKNKIPYWLFTFMVKGNGKLQVEYLVKKCKSKVGKYFMGYIIDAEEYYKTKTKPTDSQVLSALNYLSSLGIKWGLYTGYADHSYYKKSIAKAKSATNGFWWEARYGNNNGSYNSKYPCHNGADLHQYTSVGICSGISGKCDLNKLTGTKPESWFKTSLAMEKKKALEKEYHKEINTQSSTTYYKKYTGKSILIDTVFKTIGVPEKYRGNKIKRKPIAVKNGIKDYKGSASQNLKLIRLAKKGLLKKV